MKYLLYLGILGIVLAFPYIIIPCFIAIGILIDFCSPRKRGSKDEPGSF